MKTILFILLGVTSASAFAGGRCEVKTAGEMMGLVENKNPYYQLDSEGVSARAHCKASIDLSLPMSEFLEELQRCKEQAFKASFYDQNPYSRDWNRPVVRNCQ